MRPPTVRRVPSLIAGVLAMAASLTALATVVWSDFAEASVLAPQVELADDVAVAPPVKVSKVEHHEATLEDLLLDLGERPQPSVGKKSRIKFGHFEGY